MTCSTMPSTTTTTQNTKDDKITGHAAVFDSSYLEKQTEVPKGFVWPVWEQHIAELDAPVVDLEEFLKGDNGVSAQLVAQAGATHGFFQILNHGIDPKLMDHAFDRFDAFFKLPLDRKLRAHRVKGTRWGYSAAHSERFSTSLPWKETLSFALRDDGSQSVVDYFKTTLGSDFDEDGIVHQRYCEAMLEVCKKVLELLAVSLGVEREYYKEFFVESESIMRCNYYPSCPQPDVALGTGAHCDPVSITLLQQDEVPGLEVFYDDKWYSVAPLKGAIVVNIGDTFEALTNGKYKSCLHRAVVNREKARRSMAFFLCPKEDKIVKPPQSLVVDHGTRKYPDFTWSDMIKFTKDHYRADQDTLKNLFTWLQRNSTTSSLE